MNKKYREKFLMYNLFPFFRYDLKKGIKRRKFEEISVILSPTFP